MLLKSIFVGALVLTSVAFGENLTDKLSSKSKETAQVRANVLKGKVSFSEPLCYGDASFCDPDVSSCCGESRPCTFSN